MSLEEDRMRTELGRTPQRHRRMYAVLPRCIRSRRNDSARIGLSAYYHGFALQRGVGQLLHRDEERVHIHMENGACHSECLATRTLGIPARSLIDSRSDHPLLTIALTGERDLHPSSRTNQPSGRSTLLA